MEAYSLFEVNQYIRRVLALNFEDVFWVECEINQVSHSRGNLYIELIEKDEETDNIIAKSSATLWYRQYSFIKRKLKDLTDTILSHGVKVKLQVKLEFSERYGISFNIQDIDPSFTFGQFELKRQKIIDKLKEKNLLEKNNALPIPAVIQKVAIISSETAAGYIDFINQLHNNNYNYAFDAFLYQAAMQGQNTEREVVQALRSIKEDGGYDAIVIIRGGGSKLDLASFDNYNIAFEIAHADAPVFTGIGHDIDQTVTDIVAHKILKTPTAVADYIVEHNVAFESEMIYIYDRIKEISRYKIDTIKERINLITYQIQSIPSYIISDTEKEVLKLEAQITEAIKDRINTASERIGNHERVLNILQPQNILKKGFSIVRSKDKIITRKSQLIEKQDSLSLEFYDGKIELKK